MLKRTLIPKIALVMASFCGIAVIHAQRPPLQTIILDPGHGGIDPGAHGEYSTEAQCALAISFKVRDLLAQEMPNVKVLMTREKDELPGGGRSKDAALKYRANFANENKGDLFLCIHLNSANVKYGRRLDGYRTENYFVYTGKGKRKKKIAKTREVPIYTKYRLPHDEQAHGTETYIWAADKTKAKGNAVETTEGSNKEEGLESDSAFDAYLNSVEYKIKMGQYTKVFFAKSKTLATFTEDEFIGVGRHSRGVMQRNEKGIWVLQATGMPSVLVETGFISDREEEDYLNSEKGQMEVAANVVTAVKKYKELLESKIKTPVAIPVGGNK
ncbi:MAG: N-acetylmuramoyl-L-alanine amidase [Chitinophagaceae bacterium]